MSGAAADVGVTARLVDHALSLEWRDLAPDACAAAKTFLHDTLAVGIAGARAPHADTVLALARGWGEGGTAGVLGRPGVRLPAAGAAFVDAFQIHGQEFDAVHEPAVLHPLATAVAALRAEAALRPCAGAEFITALVAGVDVAVALGLMPTSPLKFFRPSAAGVFGATAALARVRRFTRAQALDAFGHALALASGTMQAHVEGKPGLPLQVAAAARSAVVAADLAAAGVPGAQDAVGGPFGYLALFETATDVAPVLAELATRRRITEVSCKPFPTGRAAQGGLVALCRLMDDGLDAGAVERLVFRAPPLIRRLVGRPAHADMDVAYARLCLPWLAAVALTHGGVGLADFTPERLADSALLALAARVDVAEDGSSDPAAFVPLVATAHLAGGATREVRVDSMRGSPADPLTRAQHLDKARACLAFAGLAPDLPDRLAAAVEALDRAPDAVAALPI